mgnify:FL=1
MAEHIQGFDEERFVSKVNQNFLCLICLSVLRDPVLCPKNHHCFCRSCITRHLENSQRCPTCADNLTVRTLAEPQRVLKDVLNELNIHCIHKNRGCENVVQLQHLERHEATCGFMPVVCSNQGCDVTVNKRDLIHHESEVCEFRKVKCHSCEETTRTLAEMERRMERLERNLAVMQGNVATNLTNMERNVTANTERNVATNVGDLQRNVGANMKAMEKNLTVAGKTNMASMRKNVSNMKQNVATSVRIMERKLEASMNDVATEVSDMGKMVAANLKNMERNVAAKVSEMGKTVAANMKNMERDVARLNTEMDEVKDVLVKVDERIEENQRKRRHTGCGDREDIVARSSDSFNNWRPEKYKKK